MEQHSILRIIPAQRPFETMRFDEEDEIGLFDDRIFVWTDSLGREVRVSRIRVEDENYCSRALKQRVKQSSFFSLFVPINITLVGYSPEAFPIKMRISLSRFSMGETSMNHSSRRHSYVVNDESPSSQFELPQELQQRVITGDESLLMIIRRKDDFISVESLTNFLESSKVAVDLYSAQCQILVLRSCICTISVADAENLFSINFKQSITMDKGNEGSAIWPMPQQPRHLLSHIFFGKEEILTSESTQKLNAAVIGAIGSGKEDLISETFENITKSADPRIRMAIVHFEGALDSVSTASRSRMLHFLEDPIYLQHRSEYAARLGMDPRHILHRKVTQYPAAVAASTAYLRNRDTQNMVWAVLYDMRDDANVKLGVLKNSKTSEKHVTRYLRRVSAESMADPRENGQLAYQQYGAVRLESVDKSVQYVDEYVRSRFGVALRRRCAALSEFSARKELALRLIESLQYLAEDGYVYEGDLLEEAYEDVTGAVLLSPLTHARPIGETVIIPPTMETMGYTRKATEEAMIERVIAATAAILDCDSGTTLKDHLWDQIRRRNTNLAVMETVVEEYEEGDELQLPSHQQRPLDQPSPTTDIIQHQTTSSQSYPIVTQQSQTPISVAPPVAAGRPPYRPAMFASPKFAPPSH